jgi:hypothetical protein
VDATLLVKSVMMMMVGGKKTVESSRLIVSNRKRNGLFCLFLVKTGKV